MKKTNTYPNIKLEINKVVVSRLASKSVNSDTSSTITITYTTIF
jgi:hypothetical protein